MPPRDPPKFSDLVEIMARMKDQDVRAVVEVLEKERKQAQEALAEGHRLQAIYREGWRHEWQEFAVTAARIVKDGATFGVLWVVLWGGHALTLLLRVEGRAADTVAATHAWTIALGYLVLCGGIVWDMIRTRLGRR